MARRSHPARPVCTKSPFRSPQPSQMATGASKSASAVSPRPQGLSSQFINSLATEKLMKTVVRSTFLALAVLSVCSGQAVITTVGGNGTIVYSGDSGPATKAALGIPPDVAVDGAGNLYIVDRNNNRIRKVDTSGTISTFAGNGNSDSSGDGGAATSAALFLPTAIAVDSSGNVYIADGGSGLRKVDTKGIITSVPVISSF